MIGLFTQNNICRQALLSILSDFPAEEYTPDHIYDAVIITDTIDIPDSVPLISLGIDHPGQDMHISTPIHPDDLVHKIKLFCTNLMPKATFENSTFIFHRGQRTLLLKSDEKNILLTEKESDLLYSLVQSYPKAMSKEDLLISVWNYRPDAETHTVESHIYALRQKLGEKADMLIKSTPAGYLLVSD